MTPSEVAKVLAKCSAYDLRTVGRADVSAWSEILGDVLLVDALDAVTRYYRESSNRAMPADVLRHSKAAKRDRLREERVRSDAIALPSKFETDEQRDARTAARMAEVRAEVRHPKPPVRPAYRNAMEELRSITTGPRWPDPEAS